MLLIVTCAAIGVRFRGVLFETTSVYNKVLFHKDIDIASAEMRKMMEGNEEDWEDVVRLLHGHPKRYALLMDNMKPGAQNGYTEYLYQQVEAREEFARKSAVSWKAGFGMTSSDAVARLSVVKFPSTRRIAIEFLKMERSSNDTFGFDWKREPVAGDPAIAKWKSWLKSSQAK